MAHSKQKTRPARILEGILKEELGRQESLLASVNKAISELPNGSIQIKKRREIDYAYLAIRENQKIIFKYLGRLDSPKVKQIQASINERRNLEIESKEIKATIKEIKKEYGV